MADTPADQSPENSGITGYMNAALDYAKKASEIYNAVAPKPAALAPVATTAPAQPPNWKLIGGIGAGVLVLILVLVGMRK